ncbi:MAG: hypothetical protein IT386_06130 [Deltaproteobacteria bacterium]|nr:hypothetical protein [Deltaproteobacteria bacterium]
MTRRSFPLLRPFALVLAAALTQDAAPSLARATSADAQGASQAQPLAAEAEAAYVQGRYSEAVSAYEALAARQGASASLYYDLGAAQLASGDIGPAVLSFERARWLAPRDAGIESALATARERAGLTAHAVPWWLRARSLASFDEWALAAALLLFIVCGGLAAHVLAFRAFREGSRAARTLRVLTLASGAALVASVIACATLVSDASRAVVIAPGVALRVAPFDGAATRAALGPGEVVRLGDRHGEFVRADAGPGRRGWVAQREVGLVAGS